MSKISYPQNLELWKFIYAHPDNLCRTCQLLLWIKNFVENLSTLPVYYRIYSAASPFLGSAGIDPEREWLRSEFFGFFM